MNGLTLKQWLGVIVVAIVVAIVTWSLLNVGRMLYADWAFLHAVRLVNEQQRQVPAAQPPQAK